MHGCLQYQKYVYVVFLRQKLEILVWSGIPHINPDGDMLTYFEYVKITKNFRAFQALPAEVILCNTLPLVLYVTYRGVKLGFASRICSVTS